MSPPLRIEYASTLDGAVDANLRFAARDRASKRQRLKSILTATVSFLVTGLIVGGASAGVGTTAFLFAASLVILLAPFFALFWGFVYDVSFRRRVRAFLRDQVGEAPAPFALELRPEGLWTKDRGVELLLAWADLTDLGDADDGIEFVFRAGYVIARNKGFKSPEERAAFFEEAKRLAGRK